LIIKNVAIARFFDRKRAHFERGWLDARQ